MKDGDDEFHASISVTTYSSLEIHITKLITHITFLGSSAAF
jgi:hypothetical protein